MTRPAVQVWVKGQGWLCLLNSLRRGCTTIEHTPRTFTGMEAGYFLYGTVFHSHLPS